MTTGTSDPTICRELQATPSVALASTDELCVCDLAWVAERAENLVSHHVRAALARLAGSRREGKLVLYPM